MTKHCLTTTLQQNYATLCDWETQPKTAATIQQHKAIRDKWNLHSYHQHGKEVASNIVMFIFRKPNNHYSGGLEI